MNSKNKIENLTYEYTTSLLNLLESKFTPGPRHYGFEYEFLSEIPLDLIYMGKLYELLPQCGFISQGTFFLHRSGTKITFEPGGQIEYQSIPLLSDDNEKLSNILDLIQETNEKIFNELGIRYLTTGYIPERADSTLCLVADRYKSLHSRMPLVGTRGLEMMKGTASIHLHVEIKDISELVLLFNLLCKLSSGDDFGMQAERRDIWNNTDPSRCIFPCESVYSSLEPRQLISNIVQFTLNAEDIMTNQPFHTIENTDFNSFMNHLTTIFTDVRLNIKGPTFELRTLDSLPLPDFEQKWRKFIASIENI